MNGECCEEDLGGKKPMPSVAFPAPGSTRGTGTSTGVFVASSNSPWMLSSVFWIPSSDSCMLNPGFQAREAVRKFCAGFPALEFTIYRALEFTIYRARAGVDRTGSGVVFG